jgi:hypothetical protein
MPFPECVFITHVDTPTIGLDVVFDSRAAYKHLSVNPSRTVATNRLKFFRRRYRRQCFILNYFPSPQANGYNRESSEADMFRRCALALVLLAVAAPAQFRVASDQSARLDTALDESLRHQTLPCYAELAHPFLDFAFRFEIAYSVHCPLKEFGGLESTIAAYMRVQAGDGKTVWFTEWYRVPGMPQDLRSRVNLLHDHSDIEFGGAFTSGEGEYAVDLVLVDRKHRLFHANWKTKAYAHGAETRAPLSMQPNSVAASTLPDNLRTASARHIGHLTVLLDAAPVYLSATRLRPSDRAFLLQALYSLLNLLPSDAVRLVAFNLDQQQRVFETDAFSIQDMRRLSRALEDLELSKVSYHVLEQSHESCKLLLNLLAREIENAPATDAIILLGPTNRLSEKVPLEWVANQSNGAPPIFYLKYSPLPAARIRAIYTAARIRDTSDDPGNNNGEFPDIIQHAAAAYRGVTINLLSPTDLADALRKIDHRLHSPD